MDIFNVDNDNFITTIKEITIQLTTLNLILLNQKIITPEQYNEYKKVAETIVEKTFNDKLEKEKQEFKEKYPIIASLFDVE
jgi:hypothetical protein